MSELEIQENMSAEEAFMDTESAYEEIPEAFQKLAQLLGQDQFELLFPDKDVENQDEMRLVYLMNDAVESFLVFSGARMTGHYQKDYEGELDATLSPVSYTHLPYIGKEGEISKEPEVKVEVTVFTEAVDRTIEAIKKVHPYEEPVINAIPILRTSF